MGERERGEVGITVGEVEGEKEGVILGDVEDGRNVEGTVGFSVLLDGKHK